MDDPRFIRTVAVDWGRVPDASSYPFNLPVVKKLGTLTLGPTVTYIIGENGSGKSTLLEGIATAWGLNPEGGSQSFNFSTRDSHSQLGDYLKMAKGPSRPADAFFLRAESFYNVATEIDRLGVNRYYGGNSLHNESHGESFLTLFLERLHGRGLYILDEPEAALSPLRQMLILARIHELVQEGCQFIISTHSPIILAYPDALILQVSESGLQKMKYEETETYQVSRDFLVRPEKSVQALLGALKRD